MKEENKVNFNNLPDKEKSEKTKEAPEPKIDIEKYQDSEGLTVSKMTIGLWLVENRKNLLTLAYGVMILISAAAWVYFLFIFGYYVSVGMKQDQIIARDMAKNNLVGHDFVLAFSPKEIQTNIVQALKVEEGKYDFVVQVKNPSPSHWAEIYYYFRKGNENSEIKKNFIMPEETKYILSLGEKLDSVSSINFVIEDIKWSRLNPHVIPDWKPYKSDHLDIRIDDIEFMPAKASSLSEKVSLNNLEFSALNDTPFNYWDINLIVLLKDRDKIVGVNKYVLHEFLSGQERKINVTWPGRLERIGAIDVFPEVNIFDEDAYMDFDFGSGEAK